MEEPTSPAEQPTHASYRDIVSLVTDKVIGKLEKMYLFALKGKINTKSLTLLTPSLTKQNKLIIDIKVNTTVHLVHP